MKFSLAGLLKGGGWVAFFKKHLQGAVAVPGWLREARFRCLSDGLLWAQSCFVGSPSAPLDRQAVFKSLTTEQARKIVRSWRCQCRHTWRGKHNEEWICDQCQLDVKRLFFQY